MRTREEDRRWSEEIAVSSIIKHLGIAEENVAFDERPDVIIRSYKGKTIGVENTRYHSTKGLAMVNANTVLWNICNAYKKMLKERGEIGFHINVYFSDDVYFVKNLKGKTQEVIEEIELFRKGIKKRGLRYICDVYRHHYTIKDDVIVAPLWRGGIVGYDIDYGLVRECIDKKEKKLQDYKRLEKNEGIDEYWLNVHIPARELNIYRQEDKLEVESGYDRIYLTTWHSDDPPLRLK